MACLQVFLNASIINSVAICTYWNFSSGKQLEVIQFRYIDLITALHRDLESCYLLFQHNKQDGSNLCFYCLCKLLLWGFFSEIGQNYFAEIHRFVPIHVFVCCIHILYTRICISNKYVARKKYVNFFSSLFNSLLPFQNFNLGWMLCYAFWVLRPLQANQCENKMQIILI